MFEVEYLCNGRVKKDGVNANLAFAIGLTLDTPIDFAFSPRLSSDKPQRPCFFANQRQRRYFLSSRCPALSIYVLYCLSACELDAINVESS